MFFHSLIWTNEVKQYRGIAKLHRKEDNGFSICVRLLNTDEMKDIETVITKNKRFMLKFVESSEKQISGYINKFKVEGGLRNRHQLGVDCGNINRNMTTFDRA
jgi:lantibiotic modifying enzyme